MKKLTLFLLAGFVAVGAAAVPGYAHGIRRHPTVKKAMHELREAKEIIEKLPPDAGGHIARASQAVDQGLQELSAVKAAAKKT